MWDFNSAICILTVRDLAFQCIAVMMVCDTQMFTKTLNVTLGKTCIFSKYFEKQFALDPT